MNNTIAIIAIIFVRPQWKNELERSGPGDLITDLHHFALWNHWDPALFRRCLEKIAAGPIPIDKHAQMHEVRMVQGTECGTIRDITPQYIRKT